MSDEQVNGANGTAENPIRTNENTPAKRREGATVRTLSTWILERLQLATRAGLRFGGKRDYWEVFGYKNRIELADYFAKYARQDIAARVIDAPVMATWRVPPIVEGNDEFNEAWPNLVKRFKVWNVLERADRLAGLGEYGIILLGFEGRGQMDTPLPMGRELIYLKPYGQFATTIEIFDRDFRSERFGRPIQYSITIETPTASRQANTSTRSNRIKVHWSRIVHVVDAQLDDDVFGLPRLAKIFNALDDMLKVAGGTAETYWIQARGGLHANVDKEMTMDPADAAALTDEIDEYMHELRRVIRTRGVDINAIDSDIPTPGQTFQMLISQISGATGIPQRILLGAEAGQLASEQDRANWSDRIAERQVSFAEPMVLRPFIERLQVAGVLPESDVFIEWPENFRMTPLERGQMMAQKGRAIVNFSRQSKEGFPIATLEEVRDILELDGDVTPEMLPPTLPRVPQPEGRTSPPAQPTQGPPTDREPDDGRAINPLVPDTQ